MNDGTYQEGEPMQWLNITVKFKVKHNPGNEGHIKEVLKNFLKWKGVEFNGEEIVV